MMYLKGIEPPFFRTFLSALILLFLFGCGGSNVSGPQNPQPPTPQPTPSPDNAAPEASILFPWINSQTREAIITVRGVATDDSGVSEVSVNGINAILSAIDETTVAWTVDLEASSEMVVATKDTLGNEDGDAASSRVYFGEVASTFTIDDDNQRLIGPALNTNGLLVNNLIDRVTNRIELAQPFKSEKFVYAAKESLTVVVSIADSSTVLLEAYDFGSENYELVRYNVPKTALDWRFISVEGVEYSESENALYVNVTMFSSDASEGNKSHIFKYLFNNQSMVEVIDGYLGETPIYTGVMTLSDNSLLITNSEYIGSFSYRSSGIQKILIDTMEILQITDVGIETPYQLTLDPSDEKFAYGVNFNSFSRLNTSTGDWSMIGSPESDSELFISQPRSVDFDSHNNQILISDSDLQMVVAVDANTGQLSRYMHRGIGNGKPLIGASSMEVDTLNNVIYVADSGGNAPEVIIAIDLANGNRRQIGNINQSFNVEISDLVLDQEAQQLYVIFENEILKVDLESGETSSFINGQDIQSNASVSLKGALLDKINNRLIVSDAQQSQIYSVSLQDGTTYVISSADFEENSGVPIVGAGKMAFAEEDSELVVLTHIDGFPALAKVNLDTGSRVRIDAVCQEKAAFNEENSSTITNIVKVSRNELAMVSGLYESLIYNVETGECRDIPFRGDRQIVSMIDLIKLESEQWLFLDNQFLGQLDPQSGYNVIISM